ncbi:MAG: tryptophan synthase subunit alpha [Gemmatimonadota bacterium]|nr:tryptophan synthase subunit alpha [Gemmatimonadota bacterium]
MSRLGPLFRSTRDAGRAAFIPYLTVGFPSLEATGELLDGLAGAGADVIELGIPFSDPMADGPTIQWTSQVALEQGTRTDDVFRVLQDFRGRHQVPVVLFTYLNAPWARGVERFLAEARAAGADGLLLTDLPLGSDPALEAVLESSSVDLVRLVAPTTPPGRAREIAARSQGFVYYVSRTGVTGAAAALPPSLVDEIEGLKAAAPVPVAVGFGVSTPDQARVLGAVADGVVVGSALMDQLRQGGVDGAVSLARDLAGALAER